MDGKYCAIFLIFGVVASVAHPKEEGSPWVINEKKPTVENAGDLKIRLLRATSRKLFIEAYCHPSCAGITWRTMEIQFYSFWSASTPMVKDLGNGHYALLRLNPGFDYVVEATMAGSFDRIRAKTCHDRLGALMDIRWSSGPGWLDIRWATFPSYGCQQDIEYETRHKVKGGNFSEYRIYGFYPVDDKGTLNVGPSHPCDDWPKHFCLLITEGVVAGKNHTVEIQPKRIGGDEIDFGLPSTVVVYADPHNVQGALDGGVHPDCQMWAWLAVGASLFCVAVIIGILISSLVTTYEKNQMLKEEAMNAEIEENARNEETEETALTAGTTELRQSGEISENGDLNENKAKENEVNK